MQRHRLTRKITPYAALAMFVFVSGVAADTSLPDGYWNEDTSHGVLAKTLTIRLDPDLSHLSADEQATVRELLSIGHEIQRLYEDSRHRQSSKAFASLLDLHKQNGGSPATQNLIDLYRLFKGPIGRGLDNRLVPFLPVDQKVPGKNVYPWGVTKGEIDAFLSEYPEQRDAILHLRTVVRRKTRSNIEEDLQALDESEMLRRLHHGLREELQAMLKAPDDKAFYAVPYSVALPELIGLQAKLNTAAQLIEAQDVEFARYLKHRATDLVRDDYEAGDAAWVSGRFKNLNVQVGSYETYDDELYGVKSFFGLSLLVRDPVMSGSLSDVLGWLQEMENHLPYDAHKKIRDDIPIGVYNVVADFGQARGTNTATILPNESYITRKYGRTILIRRNILDHPEIFKIRSTNYKNAVAEEFHDAYKPTGDFYRTLWHEIGHYLGVDLDKQGRSLDIALEEDSSILEEMKADLVSLFLAKFLSKKGYYDDEELRAVYSAGVRRVLRKNKPNKTQVYATMQLMQMNYFLEKGLLEYDAKGQQLRIHYDKYHPVVASMLKDVLSLQYNGDKKAADEFIDRYSTWEPDLHVALSKRMKAAETYRFVLVRYGALGE